MAVSPEEAKSGTPEGIFFFYYKKDLQIYCKSLNFSRDGEI